MTDQKLKMKSPLVFLLSASLLLTACGGGVGQSPAPTSPSPRPDRPLVGHFTDSPVEGLTYMTESQSGITDASGAFKYKEGETIQFSIGNLLLGARVDAVEEMTPVNLIPGVVLPTTTSKVENLFQQIYQKPAPPEALAFNKLHNMVTFLQALDSDKDASNGITIAAGIGTLLNAEIDVEGISLDFDKDYYSFQSDSLLKRVLMAAQSQNLVDSAFVPLPGRALDHFYDAQGISHSIVLEGTSSYDSNGDGIADSITTYSYDSNGKLLTYSNDDNADGTADRITTYTYDSNGNQLTSSYDGDGDGTADRIYTYTYDSNGNQLTDSNDRGADGIADRITTYTYDSNGNRLISSNDTNADGTADSITTYTYDSNGNRLTDSYDDNADGIAESIDTFTYVPGSFMGWFSFEEFD